MDRILVWSGVIGALLLPFLGKTARAEQPTPATGEFVPAIVGNVNGQPVARPSEIIAPPPIPILSRTPVVTPIDIILPDTSVIPAGSTVSNLPPGSAITAIDAIQAGYMNTVLQPGVAPEDVLLYLQPEGGTSVPPDQVTNVIVAARQEPTPTGFATSTPSGYTTPLPEGWIWATGSGTPINITVAPPELVAAALAPPPAPPLPSTQLVFVGGVPTVVAVTPIVPTPSLLIPNYRSLFQGGGLLPSLGASRAFALVSQGWRAVWVSE